MKKLYVIMLVAIPLLLFNRETTFAEQKNFEKKYVILMILIILKKWGIPPKRHLTLGKKFLVF